MPARRLALASLLVSSTLPTLPVAAQETQLFILATATRLHPELPYYGFEELRETILALRPDVLVLEVRPDELEERKETPGRPEYPAVAFPLLDEKGYGSYPMEPGEPEFGRMVSSFGGIIESFRENEPEAAAALDAYKAAFVSALRACWRSPADLNSPLTDRLVKAKHELEGAIMGPARAESWAIWNDFMVDAVRSAVARNPGKRIVALVGYDNAYWMRSRLKDFPDARVVDVHTELGGSSTTASCGL